MMKKLRSIVLFGVLPGTILLALLVGGGAVYAHSYEGRILPGVFVGPVNVGGMTVEQASAKLGEMTQSVIKNGAVVSAEGRTMTIPLTEQAPGATETNDLVTWNIDDAVHQALVTARPSNVLGASLQALTLFVIPHTVHLPPTIDHDRLTTAIVAAFPDLHHPSTNASFTVSPVGGSWRVTVVPSTNGKVIDTEVVIRQMTDGLNSELVIPHLSMTATEDTAQITTEQATMLIPTVQTVLNDAPYTLTYGSGDAVKSWPIAARDLADQLQINRQPDGTLAVGLSDTISDWLTTLVSEVLTPTQNARFTIDGGRVKEFQESQEGVGIDLPTTISNIDAALGKTDQTIALATTVTEPTVTTTDANNLGITQVLGVGTSNFAGSTAARIKNVENGMNLLNGLLIAPDEEFSLLDHLRPFTTDNGYVNELVIEGNKITPDIGGGLCQIGTTTFRAVMNSGLPVLERSNHSLVVHYYNDPSNGNPGTDATIFDPAPDFKFKNDTGHYILFTTAIDVKTTTLTFTLWGTSDGRKGSYSPPVLDRWIPVGSPETLYSTSIPAGSTKCQNSIPGADAHFTYTIVGADGTKTDRVFTSHYRPLPKICFIGVGPGGPTDGSPVPIDQIPAGTATAPASTPPPATTTTPPTTTNTQATQ